MHLSNYVWTSNKTVSAAARVLWNIFIIQQNIKSRLMFCRGFLMSPYALSEVRMTNRNQRPNRTAEEAYFMLVSPPNSAWPKQLSLRLSTIKPGTSRSKMSIMVQETPYQVLGRRKVCMRGRGRRGQRRGPGSRRRGPRGASRRRR